MPRILRLASLCMTAVLVITTAASAQDLDCSAFDSQEEAQDVLSEDPEDPNFLDFDSDDIACESLPSSGPEEETEKESAEEVEVEYDETVTVERIVDGDTIRIDPAVDGIDEVRLIGIDTPETKDPDCDVQPYGPEALKFTRDELQGKEVDLEFDEDREDRYERLLAYVYLDDEMFNETLLEEGYAQVYTVPPNDRYEDRFEEAQEAAQEEVIGIWGLSSSEQDLLADRGNGIGGEECSPRANSTPPVPPPPPPPPPPLPDADGDGVPEEDVPSTPATLPRQSTPSTPPSSGLPSGGGTGNTCGDFSTQAEAQAALPVNPKLDGNNDGQACENLP